MNMHSIKTSLERLAHTGCKQSAQMLDQPKYPNALDMIPSGFKQEPVLSALKLYNPPPLPREMVSFLHPYAGEMLVCHMEIEHGGDGIDEPLSQDSFSLCNAYFRGGNIAPELDDARVALIEQEAAGEFTRGEEP